MSSNGTVSRWIMNGLLTIVLLLVTWWVNTQNTRIEALENSKSAIGVEVTEIKWIVRGAREDICSVKGDIADLREELTKRRVFRRPCP